MNDAWPSANLVSIERLRELLRFQIHGGDLEKALRELIRIRTMPAYGIADAPRIDWLEGEAYTPGGLLLHDGTERGRRGLAVGPMGLRPNRHLRTLREAIDQARGVARPEPGT
jgi:hypothetical protein